jgi:UDPglucose 6-dehydrogenase
VRVFQVGIDVTCVDIDRNKIDNLNKGIIPIYEPEEMITKYGVKFTTNIAEALKLKFYFCGTPPDEDGSAFKICSCSC